jgi:hypothetical protein
VQSNNHAFVTFLRNSKRSISSFRKCSSTAALLEIFIRLQFVIGSCRRCCNISRLFVHDVGKEPKLFHVRIQLVRHTLRWNSGDCVPARRGPYILESTTYVVAAAAARARAVASAFPNPRHFQDGRRTEDALQITAQTLHTHIWWYSKYPAPRPHAQSVTG